MSDFKAKMHQNRSAPHPLGELTRSTRPSIAVFKGPTSKGKEGEGEEREEEGKGKAGPDLRGAQGARAPGPPPTRGPPPNPSYFIFGSIDTHKS